MAASKQAEPKKGDFEKGSAMVTERQRALRFSFRLRSNFVTTYGSHSFVLAIRVSFPIVLGYCRQNQKRKASCLWLRFQCPFQ